MEFYEKSLFPEETALLEEAEDYAHRYGSELLKDLLEINRLRLRTQAKIQLLRYKALKLEDYSLHNFLEKVEETLLDEFEENVRICNFIQDPGRDLGIKIAEKSLVVIK